VPALGVGPMAAALDRRPARSSPGSFHEGNGNTMESKALRFAADLLMLAFAIASLGVFLWVVFGY